MAEKVVSVKMPSSLVNELRKLQEKNHYLDLSEQLRSVVRQKCLELSNPYTEGLKSLRADLTRDASESSAERAKEKVLRDLIQLLKEDER